MARLQANRVLLNGAAKLASPPSGFDPSLFCLSYGDTVTTIQLGITVTAHKIVVDQHRGYSALQGREFGALSP